MEPQGAAEAAHRGAGRAAVLAFLAALGIKAFFFDLMIAEGRSMLPVIKPGAVLLVNRAAYGLRLPGIGVYLLRWNAPQAGDVVVFYTPEGTAAVKRCVHDAGAGAFIALGDNTAESYDSRVYGPIPAGQVIGKVLGVK